MKSILMIAAALTLLGCAGVRQEEAKIQKRDAAMDAATARMIIITGATPGKHPGYVLLGPVQGYCEKTPRGDEQVLAGDSMKQAAYRKYGARVDAIVDVYSWFNEDANTSAVYEPYTPQGHFECAGTAVHFAEQTPAQK